MDWQLTSGESICWQISSSGSTKLGMSPLLSATNTTQHRRQTNSAQLNSSAVESMFLCFERVFSYAVKPSGLRTMGVVVGVLSSLFCVLLYQTLTSWIRFGVESIIHNSPVFLCFSSATLIHFGVGSRFFPHFPFQINLSLVLSAAEADNTIHHWDN